MVGRILYVIEGPVVTLTTWWVTCWKMKDDVKSFLESWKQNVPKGQACRPAKMRLYKELRCWLVHCYIENTFELVLGIFQLRPRTSMAHSYQLESEIMNAERHAIYDLTPAGSNRASRANYSVTEQYIVDDVLKTTWWFQHSFVFHE